MNTECNGNCDQGRRCDCENLESVQSALKVAQDNPYWENEAKRYAGNAEYWRERAEKAEAKLAAIGGRNRSLLSVRVGYAKTGGKMSKADELFKKYQADGWIGPTSFKAALREYGALVRKEDDTLRDLLELKQLVTPMMEFKRREWVGLTEDEIWQAWLGPKDSVVDFASAIEDKLKEKNGG